MHSFIVLLLASLSLINAQTLRVSTTARCGAQYGLTCLGSTFGNCCSQSVNLSSKPIESFTDRTAGMATAAAQPATVARGVTLAMEPVPAASQAWSLARPLDDLLRRRFAASRLASPPPRRSRHCKLALMRAVAKGLGRRARVRSGGLVARSMGIVGVWRDIVVRDVRLGLGLAEMMGLLRRRRRYGHLRPLRLRLWLRLLLLSRQRAPCPRHPRRPSRSPLMLAAERALARPVRARATETVAVSIRIAAAQMRTAELDVRLGLEGAAWCPPLLRGRLRHRNLAPAKVLLCRLH